MTTTGVKALALVVLAAAFADLKSKGRYVDAAGFFFSPESAEIFYLWAAAADYHPDYLRREARRILMDRQNRQPRFYPQAGRLLSMSAAVEPCNVL